MDEYQEVFGVPAETAQDVPAGDGENEREDAGPAPGEGERDQESPPPLALRNSGRSPPPAPLAQRTAWTQTGTPARRSGTGRRSFAGSGKRPRDTRPCRRAGTKSMQTSSLDR